MTADIKAEWLEKQWEDAKGLFADKFQWSDLTAALKIGMESLKLFQGATGEEKNEMAVAFLCKIIDETDTPYLPDWISDPVMKAAVRAWGPSLITLLCGATKGELDV